MALWKWLSYFNALNIIFHLSKTTNHYEVVYFILCEPFHFDVNNTKSSEILMDFQAANILTKEKYFWYTYKSNDKWCEVAITTSFS